jgi:hypothetical protein
MSNQSLLAAIVISTVLYFVILAICYKLLSGIKLKLNFATHATFYANLAALFFRILLQIDLYLHYSHELQNQVWYQCVMFVVESVVFTFYFLNIARVIASWMLTTQIASARDSNMLESDKMLSKDDLSEDLVRKVTGVNRMIRYFLFAYYLTGIPMLIQNAILW